MIQLHVFAEHWGLDASPFCLKVETYCRLANIPFETVEQLPFKSPRGKLPYLTEGDIRIPDSELVIAHLRRTHGDRLDSGLTDVQHATGHLIQRVCDESLYFVLMYTRWIDPVGWSVVGPEFFGALPPVMRSALPPLIRRGVRRTLHAQGYGRHRPDDVYAKGEADLAAIAALMPPNGFVVSDAPTSYDATLYAFVVNILVPPVETPLKHAAARLPQLTAYLERMRAAIEQVKP